MNFQKLKEKLRMTFSDLLLDVNHRIGGDFASVDNREWDVISEWKKIC